jgi:hypothetical protein
MSKTKTFEDFLEGRARQAKKEQNKRLARITSKSDGSLAMERTLSYEIYF